jgi:hypothetical protein
MKIIRLEHTRSKNCLLITMKHSDLDQKNKYSEKISNFLNSVLSYKMYLQFPRSYEQSLVCIMHLNLYTYSMLQKQYPYFVDPGPYESVFIMVG